MGILWEQATAAPFILIILLGGGAAWMTGRAVAGSWSHPTVLVAYIGLLACAARFLHFALAGGSLLSAWFWTIDFLILIAIGALAFRVRRVAQMTTQYFWLYERAGPLAWRDVEEDRRGDRA